MLDSAAAGNLLSEASPSDFKLVVHHGEGTAYRFFIECKSSVRHTSLTHGYKELIKSGQMARMRLEERAGGIGIYLFQYVDDPTKEVEVWYARPFFKLKYEKGINHGLQPAGRVHEKNLTELFIRFIKHPDQIVQGKML